VIVLGRNQSNQPVHDARSGSRRSFFFPLRRPLFAVSGAILAALLAAGLAIPRVCAQPKPALELFPVNGLEDRVQFWQRVFTIYGRSDVLIHDREEVSLVYEVLRFEGDAEHDDKVRRSQRLSIDSRLGYWRARLKQLASRAAAGAATAEADRDLLRTIERAHGRGVSAGEIRDLADGLHVQRGIRELFLDGWIRSGRYLPHMEGIFADMGVPREILAIPLFESGFRSESKSRKGATGVWQFIRSTGRMFLRVDRHFDERLDPLLATRGAARFLLDAHARLDSWPLAVMAYNHGTYGILNAQRRVGSDPMDIIRYYSGRQFGYASRNYYPEFLAALRIMRDPERHLPGVVTQPAWAFTQVELKKPADLASVWRQNGLAADAFFELNPSVIRSRAKPGLTLPAGFPLRLPPAAAEQGGVAARADSAARPVTDGGRTATGGAPAPKPGAKSARPAAADPPAATAGKRPDPPPAKTDKKTPSSRTVHVVQPSDTLFSLARRYGTSVEALRRLNQLPDSTIRIGQKLLIFP
jgi:membrane-bound lytic murein transglycosylase D